MAEDPKAAPGTDDPTTPGAGAGAQEPVDWEAKSKEWEKRSVGWQKQFQALQQEKEGWQADQMELQSSLQQLETQVGSLTGEKDTLESRLAEWESETTELTKAHEELSARMGKYDIIRQDFPDLLPFAELIPTTADEEGQKSALKEWNELMDKRIQEESDRRVELALRGVSPPASPPRGAGVPSEEDLKRRLEEIAGVPGHEDEYNQIMVQWMGLVEKRGV